MNEKFFDLKKEKQDRMINAALKVFAQNGYEHASTDEMVKEAGISKGLLFHYFISKLGLYTFVYDYGMKYLQLELSTGVSKNETAYFDLARQIEASELQVMKNYPYLVRFLRGSLRETSEEALQATKEKREQLPALYDQLWKRADTSVLREGVDAARLTNMIRFTCDGVLTQAFAEGETDQEALMAELDRYLNMLKKLCSKEAWR